MSKKYTKKTNRSRRKATPVLRGRVLGMDGQTIQLALPIAELLTDLGERVEALSCEAGLLIMQGLINDEVEQLVGQRHQRQVERRAYRWGKEEGHVVYAGRKVPWQRPRVRRVGGGEVPLQRYQLFQSDGRMQRAVQPRVVAGVAMRQYGQVIDAVCDGYGIDKSSVSRHWKVASAEQLRQFLERPLGELDLVALLIDGIDFRGHLLVVALGIDVAGRKHVLGLWPGATENAGVCKALLADLVQRGLATERRYLVVLDGSKALAKAARATFGEQAVIQRCQVHKERNVLDHLPPEHQGRIRQRLRAAWKLRTYGDAQTALERVVVELEALSPASAASLREGQEETLTVHRLAVPPSLRSTLRSTNPIESCFATTRKHCRNVKRWRSQEMVQRWVGTMLLEVERRFNRVRGHREIPFLVAALRGVAAAEAAA
jgi:putative transposase